MPPWARQPTTSYWPPTSAPGCSFGSKSNGVRHFGQKPFDRPGAPSRERPTCAPQTEQNRLSSGTVGGSNNAWRGSVTGTDGTWVRPAPSRDVCVPVVVRRRVGGLPPVERADPSGTWPRRVVPERPVTVLGASVRAEDEVTAARPHTSQ